MSALQNQQNTKGEQPGLATHLFATQSAARFIEVTIICLADFLNMSNFLPSTPRTSDYLKTTTAMDTEIEVPESSSSKAVLAALRALQDKIRRLETERSSALEESDAYRQRLQGLENESDQLRARDDAIAQRNIQEARSQHDRLVAEKADLEVRVSRAEDRKREVKKASDEIEEQITKLQDEKHISVQKVKDFESQNKQLETQLSNLQTKERELGTTLSWESRKHDEDMASLTQQLEALQTDLLACVKEKSAHDSKMSEMDHLVGQLLAVNETLVSKLTGSSAKRGTSKQKSKLGTNNKKSSSTRNLGNSKMSATPSSLTPDDMINTVKDAKSKSSKIAQAAAKLKAATSSPSRSVTKPSTKKKPSSPSYHHQPHSPTTMSSRDEMVRVAKDVRSMKDVNNLYEDMLKGINENDPSPVNGAGLLSSSAATAAALRKAATSLSKTRENVNSGTSTTIDFDGKLSDAESEDHIDDNNDSESDKEEPFDIKAFETELSRFDDNNDTVDENTSDVAQQALGADWLPSAPTSAIKGNTDIRASMNSSANADDYMSKLSKLEVEFHDLDQQYHRILNGVELSSPTSGSSTTKNPSESASDLVDVIRKLHEKSHELREMRSSPLRFE